jgi:hypothetical protein
MRRHQYQNMVARLSTVIANLGDATESMRRLADSEDEGIRATESKLSAGGALIEMQGSASLHKALRLLTELTDEYENAKRQEALLG